MESRALQMSLIVGSISVSMKFSARIINSGGSLEIAGMLMVLDKSLEVAVAI
jgi:hypothetical protein